MVVGGRDVNNIFSSVELFPSSHTCSIPDLPQPRRGHSLSLLSGGRLVVCGGYNRFNLLDSCMYWVAGNPSWTPFHDMRCLSIIFTSHNHFHQTKSRWAPTSRSDHTAWTPPSLPDSIVLLGGFSLEASLNAETLPGIAFTFTRSKKINFHFFLQAVATFLYTTVETLLVGFQMQMTPLS